MYPESEKYRATAATDLSVTEHLSCPEHLLCVPSLVPRPSSLPAGRSRQGGFSLPLAIFIIVIMGLIGTAMVSLSQTGQRSIASEVQSIRTFYAAETGAQYAVALIFPIGAPSPGCGTIPSPPPASPPELTLSSGAFAGCTVELTCEQPDLNDDSYRIISDAACSFADNDTRRQIEVMVRQPD